MEKVLQWIIKQGGIAKMEELSNDKSKLLYELMANSNSFYASPIDENVRSRINVPFRVGGPKGNEDLETKFLEEAEKLNMHQLKGHRSIGGIRASLYNAITVDEVKLLIQFMKEFQNKYGKQEQ